EQLKPLAKFWRVSNSRLPELLNTEKKLILIDSKLQPLLNDLYFGGTYVDVKANKIDVNTVDQSKVKEVKNSSQMKKYKGYLNFINATKSLNQLNSTFGQIVRLSQKFNITNGIISIEPKVNNVVVYLNDTNDQKNKEFIESINFFEPIIRITPFFSKKEEMIIKPSTLFEKRNINMKVVGGSEIVQFIENRPSKCSA
ncbi:3506_t:CDS:1, partial [Racocetra persica]